MSNRKLSRREFLLGAGAGLFGTALAACAPKAVSTLSSLANEILEINFWNGVGPPEGTLLEEFVYDYQTNHPELKINQWTTDWDPFYTKIRTVPAEGKGPDLCVTHPNYLATYADTVFKPIDSLVSGDPEIKADMFNETPWQVCFRNGKQYAIPIDVHCISLFVNLDMLQSAGFDLPQSEDDLTEMSKALTKSPDQWGFYTMYDGAGALWMWLAYMAHRGQKGMLNEEGTKAAFNNEAGIGALQRMYDNIHTDKISPGPDIGLEAEQAFTQNQLAFFVGGTWTKFTFDAANVNYTSVMFTKKEPGTWGNSHILVFPQLGSAQQTQAAWALAKHIVLNHSVDWGLKAGHIPALKAADEDPGYKATLAQMQGFTDMLPYIVYLPMVPQQEAIAAEMMNSLGAALRGDISVKDALSKSEAKVNELLSKPL
jgi:multiple sugar transport system substrate-binding protein